MPISENDGLAEIFMHIETHNHLLTQLIGLTSMCKNTEKMQKIELIRRNNVKQVATKRKRKCPEFCIFDAKQMSKI
jgi:hypothetical protein